MHKKDVAQPIVWLDSAESASYPGSGATWHDLTGNGNNAVMSGSVAYLNNVMKLTGGYFDFGVNNNMKIGLPLSLTFVINAPKADASYDLFRNDDEAYSGVSAQVGASFSNFLQLHILDGSGGTGSNNRRTYQVINRPPHSQWCIITMIFKGVYDIEIYVNNTEDIGNYSGTNYSGIGYLSGAGILGKVAPDLQIRAFKMYPYALTAQQVEDDYNYYSHML